MRDIIIAGNWKMNLSLDAAKKLAEGIRDGLAAVKKDAKALVFPSDLHIPMVSETLQGVDVGIGIQNIYPSKLAAFTGESCVEQIKDFNLQYVLLGHSERRQFLAESNEFLNQKLKHTLEAGMKVVFCIGETLEQRESGATNSIIETQLKEGLKDISAEKMKDVILAYEPVWAIGTGKVATTEQAQEVHKYSRQLIGELYGEKISQNTSILYGGSVKPDNVKALISQEDIDGALVGGASQKPDTFLALF